MQGSRGWLLCCGPEVASSRDRAFLSPGLSNLCLADNLTVGLDYNRTVHVAARRGTPDVSADCTHGWGAGLEPVTSRRVGGVEFVKSPVKAAR